MTREKERWSDGRERTAAHDMVALHTWELQAVAEGLDLEG